MKLKQTLASLWLLSISSTASAGLINSGFESGDLSNWGSTGNVSVSTSILNFLTQNYGGIGPIDTFEGNYMAQLSAGTTSASTLASIMGTTEAALEATNNGVNARDGSLIYQSSSANAGDSFTFNWNFVEEDYTPYDDWAFYGVQFEGGVTELFKFASLATTGPNQDANINGWESITVTASQTGNYTFYFGVVNALDTQLDSNLFIDGITGTGDLVTDTQVVPEPSTLAILSFASLGLLRLRRKA